MIEDGMKVRPALLEMMAAEKINRYVGMYAYLKSSFVAALSTAYDMAESHRFCSSSTKDGERRLLALAGSPSASELRVCLQKG